MHAAIDVQDVTRDRRGVDQVQDRIRAVLARCNGQVYGKEGAAALLGMKPTTLWSRLRSLGIGRLDRYALRLVADMTSSAGAVASLL
jgi:hypothetical protein